METYGENEITYIKGIIEFTEGLGGGFYKTKVVYIDKSGRLKEEPLSKFFSTGGKPTLQFRKDRVYLFKGMPLTDIYGENVNQSGTYGELYHAIAIVNGSLIKDLVAKYPEKQEPFYIELIKREYQAISEIRDLGIENLEKPIALLVDSSNVGFLKNLGFKRVRSAVLVTEYIRGQNLEAFLKSNRQSLNEKVNLANALIAALTISHENNIIHPDLHPRNIMLTEEGEIVFIDMGLPDGLLQEGEIFANISYSAPEILIAGKNGKSITRPMYKSANLYSLGLIIYEMFAGEKFCLNLITNEEEYKAKLNTKLKNLINLISSHSFEIDITEKVSCMLKMFLNFNPDCRNGES